MATELKHKVDDHVKHHYNNALLHQFGSHGLDDGQTPVQPNSHIQTNQGHNLRN